MIARTSRRGALGLIGAVAALPAAAQTFPSHPIKLVVPHAPGGNSDTFGRILAQKLTERIGQQVVASPQSGLTDLLQRDVPKWGKAVKDSGAVAE